MSSITITINTDGASFDEQPEQELARMLTELAKGVRTGNLDGVAPIRDINGNSVGYIIYEEDEA